MQDTITIPMEEYKKLLEIKGRYEELKTCCFNFDFNINKELKNNIPFNSETWINSTSGGILQC